MAQAQVPIFSGITSPSTGSICPGRTVTVGIGGGNFPNCVGETGTFTVDIASGGANFNTDVRTNIGSGTFTVTTTNLPTNPPITIYPIVGSATVTIPTDLIGGTNYRIRVNYTSSCTGSGSVISSSNRNVGPVLYSITGGGTYCGAAGLPIGLSGSISGTSYQLKNSSNGPVGAAVPGTGNAISFGPIVAADTYTVTATNTGTGSCARTMAGSAIIVISQSPVVNITGLADSYCQNASPITLAGTAFPTGGSFTIDNISATSLDPSQLSATTHTVVYTYTDPVYTSCTGSDSKVVNIITPILTQAASVSTAGPVCAGLPLTLSFGVNCPTNSTFMAELSNASGSFAAPVSLGSVSPGGYSVTIPATTLTGTGYKIRVVGTNPVLTSTSGAFSVTGLAGNFSSTPTVSQTPACAGAKIKVSFTVKTTPCAFPSGDTFSAQLSNAAGSFASPISLGVVSPGTNLVTVPETVPTGSGYRVRVVYNAAPTVLISPVSAAFGVNQPGFSGAATVSLDNKCAGEAVRVYFTVTTCAFFPGNIFSVELSNSSGNFSAATTLMAPVAPGLNNVVIPAGTPAGTGYKLRIKSSNPTVTSTVSNAFKVKVCNTREAAPDDLGLQVSVSPNPSPEGKLRIAIRGTEGQRLNVALFNGTGKAVREQAIGRAAEEEVLEWEIARQPQGLYLLRVSGEKESKTVKVLH